MKNIFTCATSTFRKHLTVCGELGCGSDVVLETRVLVSRRLEDKNESLGLGLEHLVLVSVKKKSCSFSRHLLQFLTAVSKANHGIL